MSGNLRAAVDSLDICFAVVSAIIERVHNGQVEVLLQTRWKPDRDPIYSGTLEIPAGGIHKYENVYDALRREVREETGLRVLRITPDIRTEEFAPREDGAFAFVPFCCQQQTRGGMSRVGFVFICEVEDKPPVAKPDEAQDIRWMTRADLKRLIATRPERIFTFQLGALNYYLNHCDEEK
jgi:8-oxo-dGTP pyrophosphatase MutT (NUDIX family)